MRKYQWILFIALIGIAFTIIACQYAQDIIYTDPPEEMVTEPETTEPETTEPETTPVDPGMMAEIKDPDGEVPTPEPETPETPETPEVETPPIVTTPDPEEEETPGPIFGVMVDQGIDIFDAEVIPGQGLQAESYYTGTALSQIPDFETLTPYSVWLVGFVDVPYREYIASLPELNIDLLNNFSMRLRGWINTDKFGIHGFKLVANDGARLFIDDQLVIDQDGVGDHTGTGEVILTKGFHKVEIQYFQGDDTHLALQWYWTQPDGSERIVQPNVLYPPEHTAVMVSEYDLYTLYSDEFDGIGQDLLSFWQIVNEPNVRGNVSEYLLNEGNLEVTGSSGQYLGGGGRGNNLTEAWRAFQLTDHDQFTVETSFVYSSWSDRLCFAGLSINTVGGNPRDGNLLQLRGSGFYRVEFSQVGAAPDYNPHITVDGPLNISLRIDRNGDTYTAWYKPNAESDWQYIGRNTKAIPEPLEVGLFIGNQDYHSIGENQIPVVKFDYFRVTTPE